MSSGGGSASARPPTSFTVLEEVPLKHLPNNGRIAVQRQRGGYVPDDAVQFYIGWSWDAPNGGRAWKGGGSVQAGQVQDVIDALAGALDKAKAGGGQAAKPEAEAGNKPAPTYVALAEVPLKHLTHNGGKFVVQRQCGGKVPDGVVQFYLGWANVRADGKTSWMGGGSVSADQVQDVIDALAKACESETGRQVSRGDGAGGPKAKAVRTGTFADMCDDGDGDDNECTGDDSGNERTGDGDKCVTFADALDDKEEAG